MNIYGAYSELVYSLDLLAVILGPPTDHGELECMHSVQTWIRIVTGSSDIYRRRTLLLPEHAGGGLSCFQNIQGADSLASRAGLPAPSRGSLTGGLDPNGLKRSISSLTVAKNSDGWFPAWIQGPELNCARKGGFLLPAGFYR